MNKRRPWPYLSVLLLGCTAILSGCGEDNLAAARLYVMETKQRTVTPIEPLPEVKVYHPMTYSAMELRSPFVSAQGAQQTVTESYHGPVPDFDRPKEPLEQFSLDSLRMVGSLNIDEQRWAIILDKNGVVHRVHPGNYMGQDFGHIRSVTEDSIQVTEMIPDNQGGWKERDISLAVGD